VKEGGGEEGERVKERALGRGAAVTAATMPQPSTLRLILNVAALVAATA